MSDDYLWDRSGEPDPEIERLEHTLGKLRHQPRPLRLPVAPSRRHSFHGLAAAAAVALMILAGGTWLALSRRPGQDTTSDRLLSAHRTHDSLASLYGAAASFALSIDEDRVKREANAPVAQTARENRPRRVVEERQTVVATARSIAPKNRREERMMSEGELAKERLMLALHFASSKLNLVQRKIQDNKERGPAS
jgi:hypothetical protein